MKFPNPLLVAFACLTLVPASWATPPQYRFEVDGRFTLTATGEVADLKLGFIHPGSLQPLVRKQVLSWRFESVVENGVPTPVTTEFRLILHGRDVDHNQVAVTVGEVRFNEVRPAHWMRRNPPTYPYRASRDGVGARVDVAALILPDGQVSDIHVRRVGLSRNSKIERMRERDQEHLRHLFGVATVKAMRRWQLKPFDGEKPEEFRIAFVYQIPGAWQTLDAEGSGYAWGTEAPIPWRRAADASRDLLVAGVADSEGGSLVLGGDRIQLKGEVIGASL